MRRLVAVGCCFAYLAFGLVAAAAHVHETADHHEEMHGLHLAHVHLDEAPGHEPGNHQGPVVFRPSGHHEDDALYLTVSVRRSLDSGLRVLPVMATLGEPIAPPDVESICRYELPEQLRGPPKNAPTSSRAPPA